jgi:hypothetical protein
MVEQRFLTLVDWPHDSITFRWSEDGKKVVLDINVNLVF